MHQLYGVFVKINKLFYAYSTAMYNNPGLIAFLSVLINSCVAEYFGAKYMNWFQKTDNIMRGVVIPLYFET